MKGTRCVASREFADGYEPATSHGVGNAKKTPEAPSTKKDFALADWALDVMARLGDTQEEFAAKLGLGRTAVGKWSMSGPARQSPGRETIVKIWDLAPAGTPPPPRFGTMLGGQDKAPIAQPTEIAKVSDPAGTSSGTPAVKGTHGKDFLELELESRIGIINDTLYDVLKDTIGNLRGAATSPEGARKTIDAFIAAYAAGLRRRGDR